MAKQIITYKNGFTVKLHNKRVEVEEKDSAFEIIFTRLMDKGEKVVVNSPLQWQVGKICYTAIKMTDEGAKAFVAGFLTYAQTKGEIEL